MGGRFEQKVDLFVLFFLSVKGGGGAGACSRDFVLNPCAANYRIYTFQANFRLNKITFGRCLFFRHNIIFI